MTPTRSFLAVAALGAALVLPSSAAAAAKGCKLPKGATVQDQNRYVLVYHTGSFEDRIDYGCYFKSGRVARLPAVGGLRLAGALIAYEMIDSPGPAGSDDGRGVEVFDLKARKTLFSHFFDSDDDGIDISIPDIELTKTGTVSIIAKGDKAEEFPGGTAVMVAKKGAKAFTVLDTGAEIVEDSLAISGKFVFWMNGATAKSSTT